MSTQLGSPSKKPIPCGVLTSFLSCKLNNDFHCLKEVIMRSGTISPETGAITEEFVYQLIEELFRYLYLLARTPDNTRDFAPSKIVAKAFHCLLLDPITYYQVCDNLLLLVGVTSQERPMRVLPHNPLCTDNKIECHIRYKNTLHEYENYSEEAPPEAFWPAISNSQSGDSQDTTRWDAEDKDSDASSLVGLPIDESRYASRLPSRSESRNVVNME